MAGVQVLDVEASPDVTTTPAADGGVNPTVIIAESVLAVVLLICIIAIAVFFGRRSLSSVSPTLYY